MASNTTISPTEFTVVRRLLSDEAADVDQEIVRALVAKRFVRRSGGGWVVTVEGHATYLHELSRSFGRRPTNG